MARTYTSNGQIEQIAWLSKTGCNTWIVAQLSKNTIKDTCKVTMKLTPYQKLFITNNKKNEKKKRMYPEAFTYFQIDYNEYDMQCCLCK